MKGKQILITGSRGFIGSYVVKEARKKYDITEVDNKISSELDIFSGLFDELVAGCDVVIHLAAEISVPKSIKNPSKTYYTNVLGTARVLESCVVHKKKLVFVSSAAAQYPESSPYANSKKIGEDMVLSFSKHIPVVVLRLFNVYGEGMSGENVMSRFLNDHRITINGDGEQTRDFINVKDVAAIVVDSVKSKWNNKTVEVGTGEARDLYFVADTFRHFRKHRRVYFKTPVQEIKHSKADTTVLDSLYKLLLETDLIADIERMVANAKK